jgi:hypothetical protein
MIEMAIAALLLAVQADVELGETEWRMVDAINEYRADRELPLLEPDPILMRVARQRVDVFDHCHPRHGWVQSHAKLCGFRGFATDNLAQGHPSPETAVGDSRSGWGCEVPGRSVGHDKQMKGYAKINGRWVNRRFNRVGVANRDRNWIAVFGRCDE